MRAWGLLAAALVAGAMGDAPVLTELPHYVFHLYNYPDGGTSIMENIVVTDADGSIDSAEIKVSEHFHGGDTLAAATTAGGIVDSFNAHTGVLTLTGTTTPANYQTTLRSITFDEYSAYNLANTSMVHQERVFYAYVNDGTSDSNVNYAQILFVPYNPYECTDRLPCSLEV